MEEFFINKYTGGIFMTMIKWNHYYHDDNDDDDDDDEEFNNDDDKDVDEILPCYPHGKGLCPCRAPQDQVRPSLCALKNDLLIILIR